MFQLFDDRHCSAPFFTPKPCNVPLETGEIMLICSARHEDQYFDVRSKVRDVVKQTKYGPLREHVEHTIKAYLYALVIFQLYVILI